jgi:hypothetical protein
VEEELVEHASPAYEGVWSRGAPRMGGTGCLGSLGNLVSKALANPLWQRPLCGSGTAARVREQGFLRRRSRRATQVERFSCEGARPVTFRAAAL